MKKYLFIAGLFLLSSCAYYNTFFNAKKYFREANKLPLVKGRSSSEANKKYNKAIKKCGIIITDYKNSKYVDDAVFMLGKIFYFKGINECDFIIKENNSYLPVQVSYDISDYETRKREIKGLNEACKHLGVSEGLIITFDSEENFTHKNIEVNVVPVYKYFLPI